MALWTPANYANPLAGWFDAADSGSITIGDGVSQWNDKSGNNRHVYQATAGYQPAFVSTPVSGISFDGIDDLLSSTFNYTALPLTIIVAATKGNTRGPFVKIGTSDGVALGYGGSDFDNIGNNLLGLKEFIAWVTTSTTVTANSIAAAYFPNGTTPCELRQNGSLVTINSGATDAPLAPNGKLYIGGYSTRFCNAIIHETIIISANLSTDDRQKFEGYLAWKWGWQANLPADHPYKNAAPTFSDAVIVTLELDQPVSDYPVVAMGLDQPIGMAIELLLNQPVRDLPVIMMTFNQWVRDLRRVTLGLNQPVSDCPLVRMTIDQPVAMPGQPTLTLNQPVVLADHPVTMTLVQPVILSENSGTVTLSLNQPVVLVNNESIMQRVSATVTVAGKTIDFDYLRVGADDADGFMSATISFPDPAQYAPLRVGDEVVIVETVEGLFSETTILQVESLANPEETGSANHELIATSPTVGLAEELLTEDVGPGIAKDISISLVARYGKTLDWQGVDNWPFLAGELTADTETAYAVLVREAQASGAFLQSQPDGVTVRLVPEYAVDVDDWPTCATDFELSDQDHIFSIAESPDQRDGYNVFLISGQSAAAGNYRLDDTVISATVKEFMGYIVPWSARSGVYLDHKGGDWVSIDYLGEHEETVTDVDVVVESGLGRLSFPCYGLVSWRYKEDGLGDVYVDGEDGSIRTAQVGDALLEVNYRTRYLKWRATDPKGESVLFYLDRV